jgi:uncharacterized membrane protein
MTAFARIPDHHGISAMQAINRVIQRSLFMPLFFATTLVSVALMVFAVLVVWGSAAATVLLAAGATHVLGFVCTIVFNVPLNNALDAADPASNEAAVIWRRYLARWTAWNHVRTLASTVASALYIAAAWAR